MFKKRADISETELRELYVNQGLTMMEIGSRFGVGESSVRRRLHELGIVTRPRGPKGSRPSNGLNLAADELRDLYLNQKRSIPQIAELYQCGNETVRQHLLGFGVPIRSFSQAHLVQHGTYNAYKDFTGDEREKAYLLGFRLGDLHVRREHKTSEVITITCGSTKTEQIQLIRQLFAPYGHVSIGRRFRLALDGLLEHTIRCSVNNTFEFLENYISELPSWIFHDDETFIAFLGGFTDAEGSFHLSKTNYSAPRARYSLKNTDKRILEQCRVKLVSMGIECTNISLAYKAGWISKRGVHARKDLWAFSVERKDHLLLLIRWLTPYVHHAGRRSDMERVRQNVEWRNSEVFQREATRKRVESTRRTKEAKKKNRN